MYIHCDIIIIMLIINRLYLDFCLGGVQSSSNKADVCWGVVSWFVYLRFLL